MADIAQVLATYDALVGVALGAGLTYGFGALNRRHQEAREDKTRWYETRLKAYGELSQTFLNMALLMEQSTRSYAELREARERAVAELSADVWKFVRGGHAAAPRCWCSSSRLSSLARSERVKRQSNGVAVCW